MMKKYPFSVKKNAHSIEYYHNHLFCIMRDMETGEIPFDEKRYNAINEMYYGELMELYELMFDNPNVVYLTGKQIALAKKIVMWASESRANNLIKRGKREYLQYC